MSDLKPKGRKIKLGGHEYGLRFTLNAIDDIQDHFDIPIQQLTELLKDEKSRVKNLRYLLTVLINEDIDCVNDELISSESKERLLHLDERYVGRQINVGNVQEIMGQVIRSFSDGAPESEGEEEEDPNGTSGQQKN